MKLVNQFLLITQNHLNKIFFKKVTSPLNTNCLTLLKYVTSCINVQNVRK